MLFAALAVMFEGNRWGELETVEKGSSRKPFLLLRVGVIEPG